MLMFILSLKKTHFLPAVFLKCVLSVMFFDVILMPEVFVGFFIIIYSGYIVKMCIISERKMR